MQDAYTKPKTPNGAKRITILTTPEIIDAKSDKTDFVLSDAPLNKIPKRMP